MANPGDLARELGRALMPPGVPQAPGTGVAANLALIVAHTGSGRAAGRYLGVSESTLRGWRHGVTPRRDPAFFQIAARVLLSEKSGVWGPAYRGESELVISGLVRVSGDVRRRTIHIGRYIPRRSMQFVLRAWRQGNDAQAEKVLYAAIDRYYQPLALDSIDGVWFE